MGSSMSEKFETEPRPKATHKKMDTLATRILGGASASILLHGLDPVQTGLVGEAILRLCIYMGLDPFNSHASVTPLSPNPATRQLRTMSKMQCIEEVCGAKINQSNKSGKIDCAFLDAAGTYWIISSKIGMITVYDIASLEIVDMLVLFTGPKPFMHEGKVPSPRKCALVRDKVAVRAVADRSHASNRDTVDDLTLLDISDLDRLCRLLRSRAPMVFTDIRSAVAHIVGDNRPSLQLRFHQHLLAEKMKRKLVIGSTLLLGAIPRSGKTYIAAAVTVGYDRILVLTPRPSETAAAWLSVYRNHRNFAKYAVIEWGADTVMPRGPVVAVASTQFMKMAKRTKYNWDIAFLDEYHEGGCTDLSEEMLADHLSPETIRVILTATYHKPAHHLAIPLDRQMFWDIEDANLMRSWPNDDVVSRLQDKHGAYFVARAKVFSGSDLEIAAFYQSLPQLVILTNTMQQDLYKSLPTNGSYGFSNRSLFALTEDGVFQNQKEVSLFLALLTGSEKLKHYKAGDMSIFARIRRIQKMYGHRPGDDFLTALVFLPYGVGQRVDPVKTAFTQQMQKDSVLRNFATLDLSKIPTGSTIPEMVKLTAARARAEGKDGLFLLTGNVGSLGVSIPEADVAFLLHDMESADLVFQQMLRANTEAPGKRVGIVVDFNVWRTLNVMNTYAAPTKGQSSAERREYCISKLIPYDPDLYECTTSPVTIGKDTLLNKLTEEWKKMMENVGYSISRLAKEPLGLSDEDQRQLNQLAKNLASVSGTEVRSTDQEALSNGLDVRRESPSAEEKAIEEFVKNVNLNDVLSRMIPDLLVLDSGEHDLKSTFATLYANPAVRDAMNEWLDMMYS